jgi:hypothetical protein
LASKPKPATSESRSAPKSSFAEPNKPAG